MPGDARRNRARKRRAAKRLAQWRAQWASPVPLGRGAKRAAQARKRGAVADARATAVQRVRALELMRTVEHPPNRDGIRSMGAMRNALTGGDLDLARRLHSIRASAHAYTREARALEARSWREFYPVWVKRVARGVQQG